MKTALITGITGQDGAYLAELLLEKGYRVHGIKRRSSLINTSRVDHLYQDPHEKNVRFSMHYGDMTDSTNLIRIVQETQPDEIYNLAFMIKKNTIASKHIVSVPIIYYYPIAVKFGNSIRAPGIERRGFTLRYFLH